MVATLTEPDVPKVQEISAPDLAQTFRWNAIRHTIVFLRTPSRGAAQDVAHGSGSA
jgi:hypothetical protein